MAKLSSFVSRRADSSRRSLAKTEVRRRLICFLLFPMNPIHIDKVQAVILEIRGQKVLLDHDVAKIYGVQTKRINEAVRNNPDKFPDGYILLLTKAEWDALKSKFSTSKRGGKVKLPAAFPEIRVHPCSSVFIRGKNTWHPSRLRAFALRHPCKSVYIRG